MPKDEIFSRASNNPNLFDLFTESAIGVSTNAFQIFLEAHHSELDVELILMAMLQQENSVIAQVFAQLSLDISLSKQMIQEKLDNNPKLAYPTQYNTSHYITPRLQKLLV